MTQPFGDFHKLSALLVIANERTKKAAQIKRAFVPPEAASGAAGGGAPMDPAMAGGAPPMDPAMAGGGMDPAAMGGMDPAMMGGAPPAGGDPIEAFRSIVKEELAAAGMGTGGAAAGPAGQIKPKIDVNVELMQIKKMMARIADTLGVHIPASEMVATPQDLGAMASGGGGMPAPAPGGAPPMPPKTAEDTTGVAYPYNEMINRANTTRSQAAALAEVLDRRC
jgi:hypothetical protein